MTGYSHFTPHFRPLRGEQAQNNLALILKATGIELFALQPRGDSDNVRWRQIVLLLRLSTEFS